MTEHRPTYHASNGTTETYRSTVSTLEQHYIDESTSRDIVLLLPILRSPASDDQPARCLHLIHLPCGTVGLCNTLTECRCPCCGAAMCYEHESERAIALPDKTGDWQEQNRAFLCETCATLPMQIIFALYDFRLSINAQVHP